MAQIGNGGSFAAVKGSASVSRLNGSFLMAVIVLFVNRAPMAMNNLISWSTYLRAQGCKRFIVFLIFRARTVSSTVQICAGTDTGHRVFGVAHSHFPIK